MQPADVDALIAILARGPAAVRGAFAGVPEDELRWRPEEGAWSMLEIAVHLLDEEREDFRPRLKSTLEDPTRTWPAIDPEGWVRARDYQGRDLAETLDAWEAERADSIAWLRSLEDPAWSNAYEHPVLGTLAAGDLFAAWVAHDALHLRQLARRTFQLVERCLGEHTTRYAGLWPGP